MVLKRRRRRRVQHQAAEAAQRAALRRQKQPLTGVSWNTPQTTAALQAHSPSAQSDCSEEGSTLRELYAVRKELGLPTACSPKSSTNMSPAAKHVFTVIENPLAEGQEGDEGASTPTAPTLGGGTGTPPPAVLAGWFTEARVKFVEKKKRTESGSGAPGSPKLQPRQQ